MSRIEEALRRAGRDPLAAGGAIADGNETVFSPAWDVAPGDGRVRAAAVEAGLPSILSEDISPAVRGFSSAWRERLATGSEADGVLVEQFRRLAGRLHQAQTANGLRTVMVTSAGVGDGKTLTAVNLALVLSESYRRRVLLVDADLRRPSIADLAEVTTAVGLSEALRAKTEQKLAVLQLTPRLVLLPAGRPDPDPLGGLTSPRMRRIIEEAVSRFDWVILDAPPVGAMADASLLSEMVDGALFVVRAGHTQHPMVKRAVESITRDRIIGVVLNGCERVESSHYEQYYSQRLPARG